jgi:type VI secretion system protein ImpA
MLTPDLVEALQAPISEGSPSGEDLGYDPAFQALEATSQGKPEQQFGSTVIPAVEPEWPLVADQAEALLRRTKDVRAAVLLLRAASRQQGVAGFSMGLTLLTGLLDTFWDGIHPTLDAEDNDDPTTRLNALAPLADEAMVLRDLYDARIGTAQGIGPIRVRDVAVAHNELAAVGNDGLSASQVQGGLELIHADDPQIFQTLLGIQPLVVRLQTLLADRTGLFDAVDLNRLRSIARVLQQVAASFTGSAEGADEGASAEAAGGDAAPAARAAAPGEIRTRADALQMLDRVIRYLEQTEPGNPAPLLIARAKQLIGVNFFEIMANLAPDALDTIETVTGKRPSNE